MQVLCGTCQLSFDAPEGATGLVCPICRGPLLPQSAEGGAAKATTEWRGGDLDDLIGILSRPAVSARVEVLGPTGDAAIGEVHLLAGGVSEALYGGQSTDDALDQLRAAKPTRFRVEQRLPNPTDGSLSSPGPEAGSLDGRALAHLMRYCEDYVISCSIDVWRGSENARVEYKRGEISGVTVGGIDAPERLAEVMQWSSGNYRLMVPTFELPAIAPKRVKSEVAEPVPAPAASAQAARQSSATKTIFGMPAAEIAKARLAVEAAKAAAAPAPSRTATPIPAAAPAQPAKQPAAPAPSPTPARTTPPGVAPTAVPAPMAAARPSATKTIFGVPAPGAPEGFVAGGGPHEARAAAAPVPAAEGDSSRTETAKVDRKTGARKVDVPAPAMTAASASETAAPVVAPASEPSEPQPTTQPGFETRKRAEPARPAADKARRPAGKPAQTPKWVYIAVGVAIGGTVLLLMQLYSMLAH